MTGLPARAISSGRLGPFALGLMLVVLPVVVPVAAVAGPPAVDSGTGSVRATTPPSYTLERLVQSATEHYPRRREQQARTGIAERRMANLDARFRPQLALVGQAAYHSAVPSLPASFGPGPAADQYAAFLEVDQRLWDGGRTERERAIERAARDVDTAAVDVDAYQWRQRVETAYFAVLMSDAELELLSTLTDDLQSQLTVLEARVRAGVALAGDRAVMAAELEGHRQRVFETVANRRAALDVLATLTGTTLAPDARLTVPAPEPPDDLLAAATAAASGDGVGRPELDQARHTQRLLQERWAMAGLSTRPSLTAFAQAGIGRPADQDFFQRDPTPYAVLGLRLRWPIADWGVSERNQDIQRLERQVSASRLETFLDTLSTELQRLARQLEATRQSLAADDRIVELRQVTTHQSASQLREGTITPSAYLIERNAEHRARLNRELRRLQLVRLSTEFVTTVGVSR